MGSKQEGVGWIGQLTGVEDTDNESNRLALGTSQAAEYKKVIEPADKYIQNISGKGRLRINSECICNCFVDGELSWEVAHRDF